MTNPIPMNLSVSDYNSLILNEVRLKFPDKVVRIHRLPDQWRLTFDGSDPEKSDADEESSWGEWNPDSPNDFRIRFSSPNPDYNFYLDLAVIDHSFRNPF